MEIHSANYKRFVESGAQEIDMNEKPEPISTVAVDQPVMPTAVGIVEYDVLAECPHCGKRLVLTQFPYNDYSTGYSLDDDDLGLALFGTVREPAKWTGLQVEYTCCRCERKFKLAELEI